MKYTKVNYIVQKIENDPIILDFKIRNIPIWMIVRQKIIQLIIDSLNKNSEPLKDFSKKKYLHFQSKI